MKVYQNLPIKKSTREDSTRDGHSRKKIGEASQSHTYSKISESVGKRRKRYVYICKVKLKTSLIHSPAHSSDEFKVLGDFSSKYAKTRHANNLGHNPANRNKYTRQKYNNTIVNSAVDEIILQENNKVSAGTEAQEIIESEFDENDLYRIDNMSLEEKKEKLNYISVRLNSNSKIHIILKVRMV